MDRRHFLKHLGFGAAAGTQLSLMGGAANAASGNDYCAMICVLLAGGADSFNMLVPYDQERYQQYAIARADLALARESLMPLQSAEGDSEFAVHPGMAEIQALYNQGDLAFIANVGPLAEPTTRAQIEASSAELPLGLFSHSDQIAVWQTSLAGQRARTGFAGRMADVLAPQLNNGPVSMNISLSGTNLMQTGAGVSAYSVDARDGVRSVAGLNDEGNEGFTDAFNQILNIDYNDPFLRAYANELITSIESGALMQAALISAPNLATEFSSTPFSQALNQIVKIIGARSTLGASRQTFFVTVGGWDHHDELLNNQARMLPEISQGFFELHSALSELALLDAVTTFTISDFGRTLTSNGRGSDHGWGGNLMVMGGGVSGGRVLGAYPELALGSELDLGRGRFLPTTSTDEFYAELALWFGIDDSELATVLPNIGRFYSSGQSLPLNLFG